jgi:L-asparagine transporter-like permease
MPFLDNLNILFFLKEKMFGFIFTVASIITVALVAISILLSLYAFQVLEKDKVLKKKMGRIKGRLVATTTIITLIFTSIVMYYGLDKLINYISDNTEKGVIVNEEQASF